MPDATDPTAERLTPDPVAKPRKSKSVSKPTDALTVDQPMVPPAGDDPLLPPLTPAAEAIVIEPPAMQHPDAVEPTGQASAPDRKPDPEDIALITAADAPLRMPERRRSGLLGAMIGGVLAAAAGFGVAQYVPDGWPIGDNSATDGRIAEAEAEIQTLKADLARIAETPPAPDQTLADRIAALENAPAPAVAPPQARDVTPRLEAVEAQLAAIASRPVATGTVDPGLAPAALAALQTQMDALRTAQTAPTALTAETEAALARLTEAEVRATAIAETAAATIDAATTRAALIQIRAAIDAGEPFAGALSAMGSEPPPALATFAETGLSSLPALQATFPEAARAALEAALRANMGESWTDRVGSFLRNQTGARSLTPREGTDPDAVLSRAEAALTAGDLPAAMTEIAALPPESLTAMQLWTTQAQQRLDAQAAVADLTKTLGQ